MVCSIVWLALVPDSISVPFLASVRSRRLIILVPSLELETVREVDRCGFAYLSTANHLQIPRILGRYQWVHL